MDPKALIRRFNAYCRRTRISNRDSEGRTVNIHNLRTTFGRWLSVPLRCIS